MRNDVNVPSNVRNVFDSALFVEIQINNRKLVGRYSKTSFKLSKNVTRTDIISACCLSPVRLNDDAGTDAATLSDETTRW